MKEGCYIHKKEVDWSLLNFGLNIPVALQVMFYENIKGYLKKGDNSLQTTLCCGAGKLAPW